VLMFNSDSGKANVAASVLCTTGSLGWIAQSYLQCSPLCPCSRVGPAPCAPSPSPLIDLAADLAAGTALLPLCAVASTVLRALIPRIDFFSLWLFY
jgi:hypothetical protein